VHPDTLVEPGLHSTASHANGPSGASQIYLEFSDIRSAITLRSHTSSRTEPPGFQAWKRTRGSWYQIVQAGAQTRLS
jgi:hypothetical protein